MGLSVYTAQQWGYGVSSCSSALTVFQACSAIALNVTSSAGTRSDFFAAEIAPHVPCVRRGRLKLYAIRALEQWLEANAETVLEDRRAA